MYKLNEKGASSWDLVLKILSITLVSLFAFSSGVWFGKKLSDSDYQRLALEGEFDKEVHKQGVAEADKNLDAHDDAVAESEKLTEAEVIAAADKALHGEKMTTEHDDPAKTTPKETLAADQHGKVGQHAGVKAPPEPSSTGKATHTDRAVASAATAHESAKSDHGTTKVDLSAVHQAAARVASNAAPVGNAPAKIESRVPSSLPKTVGTTNDVEFTVQVASYPTSEAAREHVDSLVNKGFPAFPVEAHINGKTWYRVSVGSFKSFSDASKYRAQLIKQTDLPSAIVSKISR